MSFDIISYIAAINAATTKDELCVAFEKALKSIGITACRYGMDSYYPEIKFEPVNGHCFGFPEEWTTFYEQENLQLDDPIHYPIPTMTKPFVWKDLEKSIEYTKRQKMIMYDSVDAGLRHGITQKIHHSAYEYGQANYVSEFPDFSTCPDNVTLISIIGFIFHQRYADLDRREEHEKELEFIRLSKRELEVLKWIAEGKSVSDIGCILSISDNTVKTFLKTSYRKLGVHDKVSAVQRCTALGFVQPTRKAFFK